MYSYYSLLQETVYVSIYCSLIYTIFSFVIENNSLLFFISGFFKHFLGYYTGRQSVFCNQSQSCLKVHGDKNTKYIASNKNLLVESILEGFWFLILGSIFLSFLLMVRIRRNKIYNIVYIFFLGGVTHLLAEWFGLHEYFCSVKCLKADNF